MRNGMASADFGVRAESPKHQDPSSRETPSAKSQTANFANFREFELHAVCQV